MLCSPRRPSSTILIFSSAEYCLRVARRISFTIRSDEIDVPDFWLISTPPGYDEAEILLSSNRQICLTSADAGQLAVNSQRRIGSISEVHSSGFYATRAKFNKLILPARIEGIRS